MAERWSDGRARRLGHYSPVGVGIWSLLAAIWPSLPQSFLTTNTCVIHTDRVEIDCTRIYSLDISGPKDPQLGVFFWSLHPGTGGTQASGPTIARPSITPILRMDQVSSIYNPGNDFFWREEGPCRARARTSPARPSLGVPPTRFGGFPVTALSQTRLNLQVPGALGQPGWFATVPWTGTSRSQVGVPPRMSLYLIWQAHAKYKKPIIKRVRALLEVYLRRTTGGFPSPVGPAIGDVLLLWTRQ